MIKKQIELPAILLGTSDVQMCVVTEKSVRPAWEQISLDQKFVMYNGFQFKVIQKSRSDIRPNTVASTLIHGERNVSNANPVHFEQLKRLFKVVVH